MGCVSCHSIKPNQVIVGPSLAGLSLRAPYLVTGETSVEYIKNSIINPDAYVVDGFLPAIMYSHYEQVLSSEEIDALVAYLSQLQKANINELYELKMLLTSEITIISTIIMFFTWGLAR